MHAVGWRSGARRCALRGTRWGPPSSTTRRRSATEIARRAAVAVAVVAAEAVEPVAAEVAAAFAAPAAGRVLAAGEREEGEGEIK